MSRPILIWLTICSMWLSCTEPEPLYCDKNKPCEPGFVCNHEINTCEPAIQDAGIDIKSLDVILDTSDAWKADKQPPPDNSIQDIGSGDSIVPVPDSGGCSPSSWTLMSSGTKEHLQGIHGSGSQTIFAVGVNGTIITYNGNAWTSSTPGTTASLTDIWTSGKMAVAIGTSGAAYYYQNSNWLKTGTGTTKSLHAVWGYSSFNIFAVGEGGTILQYNGTSWANIGLGQNLDLYAVWGVDPNNVFVTDGYGAVYRRAGTKWQQMNKVTNNGLFGIWGSGPNSIYAVGGSGDLIFFDGINWRTEASGTTNTLNAIFGTGASNIYAVGAKGTILHYNGLKWSAEKSGTSNHLLGVWVGPKYVFAVGYSGTVAYKCAK